MRRRSGSAVYVWAAWSLALCSCQASGPATPSTPSAGAAASVASGAPTAAPRATIDIDDGTPEGRLVVELPDPRIAAAPVAIDALGSAATAALIARMEPPPVLDNAAAPPLRAPTIRPPRGAAPQPIVFAVTAGKTVTDLPPGSAPPSAPVAPIRPMTPPQITPTGAVVRESEIRVRFDEAMVPIAAIGEAKAPPVALTPAVPGVWRWLDTRVLEFTPTAARLPQATEFSVTVPAGTHALSGDALDTPAVQTFSTAAVAISSIYPNTPMRPDSAIAIRFDQDVDRARIVPLLQVAQVTSGTHATPIAFHVIDLAEAERRWANNPHLGYTTAKRSADLASRVVLIAPDTAWPSGMSGRVTLAAGAPSREGPQVSVRPSTGSFDVAPELRVLGVTCGSTTQLAGTVCPARGFLAITLTNALNESTYHAEDLVIEGVPFEDSTAIGETLSRRTPMEVGRTYQVTIAGALVDIYGQPFVGTRHVSFTTGPEEFDAQLITNTGLQVLDPRFAIPQWVISAQAIDALRVQLYQVTPADYFAYEDFESGARKTLPGTRIVDRAIEVGVRHGVTARIDLRPALGASGLGHVIAVATAVPSARQVRDSMPPRAIAWFEVSKLGVTARVDGDKTNAWVRDISPASFLSPIAGASASILTDDKLTSEAVATDAEGHATLAMLPPVAAPAETDPAKPKTHYTTALLAIRTAADSVFVAMSGDAHQIVRERNALWYATDDRFTYKPGETVYAKGWVRWTTTGTNPDLALPASGDAIDYALHDESGNKLASGSAPLTDQGGFDIAVAIPDNANLGTAQLSFSTHGAGHTLPISIQEFRAPTYAVTLTDDVTHAGATPLVLGERIEMSTEAKYYAGGGLAGASIKWDARLTPTRYRPAGWDMFDFSPKQPRSDRRAYYDRTTPAGISVAQVGSLSGASTAGAVFGIAALPEAWPAVLTVDATVSDVDRMTIRATSRPILVHPSDYYVGLRLKPDHEDELEVVVTDIDGNAVPGVPVIVDIEGVLRWSARATTRERWRGSTAR